MATSRTLGVSVVFCVLVMLAISSAAARRSGEHQVRQLRPTRGFKEMELAAARNFGKRAVNMHVVNSILLEWLALENKMKNLQQRGGGQLPLDDVRVATPDIIDDLSPSDGVLLDE